MPKDLFLCPRFGEGFFIITGFILNADNELRTACYANNMIALAYKADEENAYPDNPSKRKFRIKFLQKYAENISKKEDMEKEIAEGKGTKINLEYLWKS